MLFRSALPIYREEVAEKLGYANTRDALVRHVDIDDKADVVFHDGRQRRNMVSINESGLYALILSSKLPQAKEFKRWVTKDVLPSIRKNGGYIRNQENLSKEEILANAVLLANNLIATDRWLSRRSQSRHCSSTRRHPASNGCFP